MIIDLINVDYVNKGSYLMIIAIIQQLASRGLDFKVATDLRANGKQLDEIQLYKILRRDFYTLPIQINPLLDILASFLPDSYRNSHHIIRSNEIDAIFDAAGFGYSDQGNESLINMMSQRYRSWKKQGKKLIMLPQAFGPFQNPQISDYVRFIIDSADQIYARDKTSYKHLLSLSTENPDKIRCAPDFTNLVVGEVPSYFDISVKQPCIIPNYRMMDKTQEQVREKYIPTISYCITYLLDKGCKPFFLIHESSRDEELVELLQKTIPQRMPVIHEPNPIFIKGILAECSFVIGSRFHGLVSALSQGVPVIATSWSHKYEELLEEYGCSRYMITFDESEFQLDEMMDTMIDKERRQIIVENLLNCSNEQKKATQQMWDRIVQSMEGF